MNGEHPLPNFKEKDIFWEALKLSTPEDVDAYLNQACAGDENLRASVESLLKNHRNDDLLEHPTEKMGEKIGDTIDDYLLLEKIGEGGCGIVFRAEQRTPFNRQTALKIIKPGMDSRRVLERFEAERQALAALDHSSIARVYDAGTTKTGRPYFVMELVRGQKITDYCDSQRLTIQQRLELFVKVCRAVNYAHGKEFIHRDIKPSNILVILENDEPLPKVIDFGIAKSTANNNSLNNTINTATGQIIGTLAYMSPEQVKMSGRETDKRTDVYSLGVLLNELLVGCLPLKLYGLGVYDQLRIIVEEKPKTPSELFKELPEVNKLFIAQARQINPVSLLQILENGLDEIVTKSLMKKCSQRYEDVNGLIIAINKRLIFPPSRTTENRLPSETVTAQHANTEGTIPEYLSVISYLASATFIILWMIYSLDSFQLANGAAEHPVLVSIAIYCLTFFYLIKLLKKDFVNRHAKKHPILFTSFFIIVFIFIPIPLIPLAVYFQQICVLAIRGLF